MLSAHNLSISFMGSSLFSGITFKLNKGDKVGLIGKNGTGKSTLLKLLAKNIESNTTGTIAYDKGISIGFLQQDIELSQGRSIIEEAYRAFTEIKAIEREINQINQQLSKSTDYESDSYNQLMIDFNELNQRYQLMGGYNYQGYTEKILQGLGFKRKDFNKQTSELSGGWRMRIELAKLLLQNNDILLLDEPTNHLDIESIIWLENFLKNYQGAIVLVSHDQMFLDNTTNRTIEIAAGKIYDYKKPYSAFLKLRSEIRQKQLQTQKNQQKEIEQTQKLIEKFRAKASKASMAQSLIKKLEKLERIEIDQDDHMAIKIRFETSKQSGKIVIQAEGLSKSYADNRVLDNINFSIQRNSKIAFVGQNGQGKSTLAKIMAGEISYRGKLKLGHNVEIGYFAQNQSEYLDTEKTVLQTVEQAANDNNRAKVRDLLGAFLFSDKAIDKKVKVLSGGERNRLALCKLLLQPFNLLIMDEPTNHLDITSKNILKQALQNYTGTLIVVSHDRNFLQGLTQSVYQFKDREIKEYLGDIDYFLEQHQFENLREAEKQSPAKENNNSSAKTNKQIANKQARELKKLKNRLQKIESLIDSLEKKIKQSDLELAESYEEIAAKPNFFKDYEIKKKQLNKLMEEWEQVEQKTAKLM
ncbi:MAG: ABC-F family ATP-binding cassette domain-containing protein [Tenacibaculum sp.]